MRWGAWVGSFSLAALLSACDGSVNSPGTGGGGGQGGAGSSTVGGGGQGASGGGASNSASSGTPSTSGVGGGASSGCAAACANLEALGCEEAGPGCVDECGEGYAASPTCAAQFDAIVSCVATQTTCDVEDNCDAQVQAWIACQQTSGCGPPTCRGGGSSGGQDYCACDAVCEGQQVTAECSSFNGGQATCTCYVSGMIVGECAEPMSSSCDLEMGCCAQFF